MLSGPTRRDRDILARQIPDEALLAGLEFIRLGEPEPMTEERVLNPDASCGTAGFGAVVKCREGYRWHYDPSRDCYWPDRIFETAKEFTMKWKAGSEFEEKAIRDLAERWKEIKGAATFLGLTEE